MGFSRNVIYRKGQMGKQLPGDNPLCGFTSTAQSADSAQTISAAQINCGVYLRSGLTAGRTDTLDTAANILAANPDMSVGDSFVFVVSNTTAQTLTIGTATGITLSGNVTVASGARMFLFTKTSETTLSVVGL